MSLAELFEMFRLWELWGYPVAGQPGRLGALTRKWETLADAEKLALLGQIAVERRRKGIAGAN